jgi:hypothetical protein
MQPKIHVCYSPGEAGFVSALFHVEVDVDIYGWYSEAAAHRFSAAFFMLEHFYAESAPALYRSLEDDVYGPWIADAPPASNQIRCPLPDPLRHELERIQSKFVQDWLFFENDPAAAAEIATYHERQLALQALNVRSRKLHRLEKKSAILWEHLTPGGDGNVLEFLRKHWRGENKALIRSRGQTMSPSQLAREPG